MTKECLHLFLDPYFSRKKVENACIAYADLTEDIGGEHLLSLYPQKKVAIVSTRRIATVMALFFPEFVFLVSSPEKDISGLKEREIIVFPSSSNAEQWRKLQYPIIEIIDDADSLLLNYLEEREKKEFEDFRFFDEVVDAIYFSLLECDPHTRKIFEEDKENINLIKNKCNKKNSQMLSE